jgi:hypothetical protein
MSVGHVDKFGLAQAGRCQYPSAARELPPCRDGIDVTKPPVWTDGFARLLQFAAGKPTDNMWNICGNEA